MTANFLREGDPTQSSLIIPPIIDHNCFIFSIIDCIYDFYKRKNNEKSSCLEKTD